jgi:protein-S-isoprenylcysteine O-methyltransferase Ste14
MEEIDTGKAVVGLLFGIGGITTIAAYTWSNARARKRGLRSHWAVGLVLGTLGVWLTFAGWGFLCLAGPTLPLGAFRLFGLPLCIAGFAIYGIGAWNVGRMRPRQRYSLDLYTGGIYAHLRHPQALALSVMALGLGPLSGSIPYIATIPLWVAAWIAYTYLEERNELIPAFGERYLLYRQSTPRLLPRLFGKRKAAPTGTRPAVPAPAAGVKARPARPDPAATAQIRPAVPAPAAAPQVRPAPLAAARRARAVADAPELS